MSEQIGADEQVRTMLQRSEASLRVLVAQLPALVWTTDTEMRITSVIGAARIQPTRPPEWYIGRTIAEVLGREADELPILPAHRRALAGEAAQYERRADDRIFDVRVQPLRDHEHAIVGSLGLALEITERAAAEAARAAAEQLLLAQRLEAERVAERERARRELLSSVSHDLRTPLTSARAALGLLDTGGAGFSQDERQLLDNARRSLERLRLLVDDLLAANQFLAGVVPPLHHPVALNLGEIVAAAVADLAPLMARKGQQLVNKLHAACVLPLRGDPQRLQQAVANLLANAHYHTAAATTVTVSAWVERDVVQLAVEDDGPGIAPEVVASMFQPLHRLGGEAVGSGLGLAVARGIVEQHGGHLWYEPGPQRGVIFRLALPRAV